MKNKVYIIIVTWKGMKWIARCLDSICNSYYPVTTIVIDNNSPDETPDFIESNFPEVKLTRSKKNLGFGKANNIGMKQALEEGADYCFLLNQDAYLQPDTIGNLLTVAEEGDYGILSPVHLNGDGSHVDFYFRDHVMAKCPEYLDNAMLGGGQTIFESAFIPAAAWLLPRKTMEEIGGFDPLFYHYGEDDNYCLRCQYHYRNIAFTTSAFVNHDRESTVGNSVMYNRKLAFRHIVQDCADITKGVDYIVQKQGRQFYDEIGLWFTYLLTGKWGQLHNFLWDYIKIISMIPKFRNSRSVNKSIGCNWILKIRSV